MKKTKQILAIDIGTAALKLAVLDISRNSIRLLKTGLKEFPESIAQKKGEFIKTSIQEFLEGDISPKQIYLTLSTPYVEIERINLPYMPPNEVPEAVKWKVQDKISIKIEEAIIDYSVVGESITEDGAKEIVAMVVAAQRKEIESIISILQELHLSVTSINTVPFDLANLLNYIKDIKPEESVAIVEIGAKHTYVSICKSNKLIFTRNIPVSSSLIDNYLCSLFVSDEERRKLSNEEAEDIKKRFGIPIDQEDMLNGKIPPTQVVAVLRPLLERLTSEIRRTFTYYITELNGSKPNRIYLAGGGARLKNLDKFLNKGLNINVQYLGLPAHIKNKTKEDNLSILSFLGTIGAALPTPGRKINLLPPELAIEKVETIEKVSIRMVGLTVLSILILSYFGVNIRVADYKRRLKNAGSHRKIIQRVMDLHNKVSSRSEAVAIIRRGEISGELLLKEISNIVPANIVLDELSLNLNTEKVKFKGVLYAQSPIVEDELTRFMERIENSSFFKKANLGPVKKDQIKGKLIANFEITCSMD